MKQKAMLSFDRVSKHYHQGMSTITVLNNCSVQFEQGMSYAITGISGSGKSTLMHLLAGIDAPSEGNVLYQHITLNHCTPAQRAQFLNKEVGLVFQVPYVIKELSVIENCMLPGLINGYTPEQCIDRAQLLLKQMGIADKANHKPSSLSGGQQQRVALARALFNEPTFLLADEPTGSLDLTTGHAIIDLLLECQEKHHMGLIISTHDAYVAQKMQLCYRVEQATLIKC